MATLSIVPASLAASSTPAPASAQKLRVNIGSLPSSLDPGRARYVEDKIVANAIFTPLYRSAGGSTGSLQPWLASGQPVVSANGLRVTVRLRAAKWTDGKPITASDVVFAFNRARTLSAYAADFTAVKRATAVNARTVRFDLSARVPWFGELLASTVTTPVPTHVVRMFGTRWTNLDKIVTSGPFTPISGRGRSELMLKASTTFWAASRTRLQNLELLSVPPASASPLFRANRMDVGLRGTSILESSLSTWASDSRLRTSAISSGHYLYINTRDARLTDARVRRAIALAVDRAAIIGETAKGSDTPLSTILPSGVRGYSSIVSGSDALLTANAAARSSEATALLAQAGWTSGNTALNLYFRSDANNDPADATQIATDLARIGVRVTLHGVSSAEFAKLGTGRSPVGEDVDLALDSITPDYSDASDFYSRFTCAAVDAGSNPANFCSPEFDEAWAATNTAASASSRPTALRTLEQLLTGTSGAFPAVPLYQPVGAMLVQPWVHTFVQNPSGTVDFEKSYVSVH